VRGTASIAFAACAATAFIAVAAADTRPSGSKERRFSNAREGISVDTPPGWSLSLHTGYANLLCTLLHPGGSRISLAVDKTNVKDAAALAAESRPGLLAQGLTIERVAPGPRNGTQVDARAPRRAQAVRQLYIVRELDTPRGGRQAIVLTLTAPADQFASAAGSFDWFIAHLTLETPVRPDENADGGR
jgi:hypothetical protein